MISKWTLMTWCKVSINTLSYRKPWCLAHVGLMSHNSMFSFAVLSRNVGFARLCLRVGYLYLWITDMPFLFHTHRCSNYSKHYYWSSPHFIFRSNVHRYKIWPWTSPHPTPTPKLCSCKFSGVSCHEVRSFQWENLDGDVAINDQDIILYFLLVTVEQVQVQMNILND